jgi:hypothetical protein
MPGAPVWQQALKSTDYQPEVNNDGCKNKVEMCGMVDYLL